MRQSDDWENDPGNEKASFSEECEEGCDWEKDCDIDDECLKVIEKKIWIDAEISITPRVSILEPSIECSNYEPTSEKEFVDRNKLLSVRVHPNQHKCPTESFTVRQCLDLKIPLAFSADVDVKRKGIICPTIPVLSPVSTNTTITSDSRAKTPKLKASDSSPRVFVKSSFGIAVPSKQHAKKSSRREPNRRSP